MVNKPKLKGQTYTFDEHMWDKLPEIEKHSQQGSKVLQEFSTFVKNYNNSLQKFGENVNKHFEHFTKNILKDQQGKKSILDNNYFSLNKKGSGKKEFLEEDDSGNLTVPHAMTLALEQMKLTMA